MHFVQFIDLDLYGPLENHSGLLLEQNKTHIKGTGRSKCQWDLGRI